MFSLQDLLGGEQGDQAVDQISQNVGADSSLVNTAIQAALPALINGLANNTSTQEGAESLNTALDEDHDGSVLDNIGGLAGTIVELSKIDGSIGLSMAAHNSLCTGHILAFGNEEQKKKYLPKLATAEWIGAWGLTETATGSDAGGMLTTAKKDGDYYVLNGAKNFITHAISGNVAVVIVRTGEKGDSHGMTAFIIEKGTAGFKSGKKENKLGMRASEIYLC